MRTINIIAAVDFNGGIGYEGQLPWKGSLYHRDDMEVFRDVTRDSVVIMGRNTYNSIGGPLKGRVNIVLTSQPRGDIKDEVIIADSFDRAVDEAISRDKPVYVIGGRRVYEEALKHRRLMYVYISHIPGEYRADVYMPPFNLHKMCEIIRGSVTVDMYAANNEEAQYIQLMERLLAAPLRPNRTGISTHGLFAEKLEFSLMRGNDAIIPLITTKKVPFGLVIAELLWFISGKCTDTKYLLEHDCHIWDDNTTREFLDSRGLTSYKVGETGPIYGYQWRNWNGEYNTGGESAKGIDQLSRVIETLRNDPFDRRMIVSAWNPEQIPQMALPPCHWSFQFHCDEIGVSGKNGGLGDNTPKYRLNCLVNMRSADVALGVPFNIASYALLTHMVAKCVNMQPGRLVLVMADCHLYSNHTNGAWVQCNRPPRLFPTVEFVDVIAGGDIDQFKNPDQIKLHNYTSAPAIKYKMAV